MLCFSRDTEINQLNQIDQDNGTKSKQYDGTTTGIVPFHGICMFGIEFSRRYFSACEEIGFNS